jgi:hypothetical protein
VRQQTRKTLWVARPEIDDEDRDSRRRLVRDRADAHVDEENYDTFHSNEIGGEALDVGVRASRFHGGNYGLPSGQ